MDLETGAIVAVTVQDADEGDTTTIVETVTATFEQVEAARADVDDPHRLEEIIADKGYHSNRIMVELDALGVRSYVAEPARGRRDWSNCGNASLSARWLAAIRHRHRCTGILRGA
ncbi:MAG: hypothetical protein GEU82_05435 [Luteitalea sp.]|nr:hypothetical protein [Luteitalea sp.]